MIGGEFPYRYSKHAKWQKRERLINDTEVEECIDDYDIRCTDKKGNPVYKARISSGRGIKVVIAQDDNRYIITVADY